MWLENPKAVSVEKICGLIVNKLGAGVLQLRYGVYSAVQNEFGGDGGTSVL